MRSVLRTAVTWGLGWLGLAGIGVANGVLREALYARRMGERAAHQVSSVTAAGAFGVAVVALERRRPLPSLRAALAVGGAWALMTVTFETAMTRSARNPWSAVFADYDLRRGRLWGLVVLWIGLLPAVARRINR